MQQSTFDYVIVGAGSAGCVLAHRLSEDGVTKVLLVEAGGEDRSMYIHMPASASIAARDPRITWGYESEPEANLEGRSIAEIRGRVLGGSSSVNGMVANRGNPRDYDGWAARGLNGWSYAHCLPYFRKMETFDRGSDEYRGGDGPQHIETCPADNPLDQCFVEAGKAAGHPFTEDQNGRRHEGFHIAQRFTHRGRRWSTAAGYLRPALGRENLTVMTDAVATRVRFSGQRAVGVEIRRRGAMHFAEAHREVILCGGAINSPHLLALSGVGDAQQLAEHDIGLVAHVPSVGRYLEDHLIVPIRFATREPVSVARQLRWHGRLWLGARWLLFKEGLGTTNFCETGAFFRSSEAAEYADLQHEFYPLLADLGGESDRRAAEGFMFSMGIMRPRSRGAVRLRSADPLAHPSIRFNYLEDESDRRVMIEGVRRTREMAYHPVWDALRGEELSPGRDVRSDDEILAWIRATGSTEYHPCSTCRMGVDDESVTDAAGRVHDVEALRVVDASIMPGNVTANLNAPVIMIAEKLADDIRGREPLAPLTPPIDSRRPCEGPLNPSFSPAGRRGPSLRIEE